MRSTTSPASAWHLLFADIGEVAVYCPECAEREFRRLRAGSERAVAHGGLSARAQTAGHRLRFRPMVAAVDWSSYLLGVATLVILIGGVLAALGQIGRAWTWVLQRFRPAPPRVDLESAGGMSSHQRDEATGEITWTDVQPSIAIRNNELVSVYAVTVGIVNPAGDERIEYPGCPIPVLKAETHLDLAYVQSFQIPSSWLAGVAGGNEHKAVPYFVTLTDAHGRQWDGVIDFRETVPRLRFRRVKG